MPFNLDTLDTGEWVAVLAAAISSAAAIISLWSMLISRRQLLIAKRKEERSNPRISIYLNDSFTWKIDSKPGRLCAFSLLVTNLSDAPNSIARMELIVDYELPSGQIVSTAFQPTDAAISGTRLEFPLQLGPRQSEAGSVVFPLDADVYLNYRIRNYRIEATDAFEKNSEARAIIMRDLLEKKESREETET